ncbi:hypothetical protein [Dehalococcoides sp. THU4]|uniref:hypothetical protein n=1 Tax=Dehalococcoides sp. THU4 TaxID=3348344 RepID=UPI00371E3B87
MYCTIEGKTTNVVRNEKLERINSYLNAVLNNMDKRKEFIKNGQIVHVNELILSKLNRELEGAKTALYHAGYTLRKERSGTDTEGYHYILSETPPSKY